MRSTLTTWTLCQCFWISKQIKIWSESGEVLRITVFCILHFQAFEVRIAVHQHVLISGILKNHHQLLHNCAQHSLLLPLLYNITKLSYLEIYWKKLSWMVNMKYSKHARFDPSADKFCKCLRVLQNINVIISRILKSKIVLSTCVVCTACTFSFSIDARSFRPNFSHASFLEQNIFYCGLENGKQ